MRFDRVAVRNFKPYEDVELELDEGVTVVHGVNGSGKSSLLEACFFALYGAKALEGTLEDAVTKGEEECEVELWFTHGDGSYHVDRRVRATGARATTADCVLEGPEGSVDGARAVRERVVDLLRMDHEAFLNCAYVRQGEVNKLINASPGERQDMIDDLLQIGALEAYRERASEARLGVNDVLADKRGALSELAAQIESKEDKDLHGRLADLRSEVSDVDATIDNYESQREKAVETREDAAEVLERHAETRAEIESLAADVEDLEATIRETAAEREAVADDRREARERVAEREADLEAALSDSDLPDAEPSTVEARLDELGERETEVREARNEAANRETALRNQADNLRESAAEARERAATLRERADEVADERATLESGIEERRDRLEEVDARREALRERFEATPEDVDVAVGEAADWRDAVQSELSAVREGIGETEAALEGARERVGEAEELLEAGSCPECGQPVEGSPHVDALGERRERVAELEAELAERRERREALAGRLETAADLVETESELSELSSTRELVESRLADRRESLADAREREADLREEADEVAADAAERTEVAETKAEEAAAAGERVTEREAELETIDAAVERVERVADRRDAVSDAEATVERLDERVESLSTLNDERRDRLSDERARLADLREDLDDDAVAAAEERKERAEEYVADVDAELERLRETRDDLTGRIGAVEQELRELEELRESRDALATRVEALASLHEEAEALQRTYGDLRGELRRQNVERLERTLNETFELVYGNDAYSHIELDGNYELTVYQKDGQPLAPAQLSGGERALFNLSLRCAIYRLLAAGIDGAAPMPPLILDEPTVFLDSGHVSRLVRLVEEMRGHGVAQILIVSHDDELVGAADVLVSVEKDPTTNRSTARREAATEAGAGLAADD